MLRDSIGTSIKFTKYKIISSDFYEVHQEKASRISGKIVIVDTDQRNRILDTFSIESEFVFINNFAEMNGDKRALDPQHINLLAGRKIPFPTDEELVFDTGEDIKARLKSIIEGLNL